MFGGGMFQKLGATASALAQKGGMQNQPPQQKSMPSALMPMGNVAETAPEQELDAAQQNPLFQALMQQQLASMGGGQ